MDINYKFEQKNVSDKICDRKIESLSRDILRKNFIKWITFYNSTMKNFLKSDGLEKIYEGGILIKKSKEFGGSI